MSGIYLHIPFCRKACHYCNFHFSTSLHQKDQMVEAMLKEIKRKGNSEHQIETIYFGGGTPSLLSISEFERIFNELAHKYSIEDVQEITIECNPEDIHEENLAAWLNLGINRLSIGVQSLNDTELSLMNRNHDSEQSKRSVMMALNAGFNNISLDLIYGTPWKSLKEWENELIWALNSGINHLSAYALTIETKTALSHQVKKGIVPEPTDERMTQDFKLLQNIIKDSGWDAYEISNYSKFGFRSKHNSNYWRGKPYFGIGPSAHSFDGQNLRSWNVSNNSKYIEGEITGNPQVEYETLSDLERVNELIMTKLRTSEGLDLRELNTLDIKFLNSNAEFIKIAEKNGWMISNNRNLTLTNEGKLMSDYIISELMLIH